MNTAIFRDFIDINPRVRLVKDCEYPFVDMGMVEPYRRYVNSVGYRFFKNGGSKFLHGDTLFARITPCLENGKIAQYKNHKGQVAFGSTEFFIFRARPGISDPGFVYYLAKSDIVRKPAEKSMSGASGRQRAALESIADLKVPCPPLPIQQKIASILSAYDDLIENNLRRIKILEEMAQNLYREWFVKFRFPGHEKTKFVDSPLGRIPEGWEVAEFRNLFNIKYGKTLSKTHIMKDGLYPVYGAGDVIGYYDKVIYEAKCALVTSRGNGSGTVWRTREAAFITNNSLIILPKTEYKHWDYSFVELLLKHSNVMEAKTGSAQPQVTIENLNYVKAIVPEKSSVDKFCSYTTPIFDQVDLYISKNSTLRKTLGLLLPKLISGEVDVSELDITIPDEV